jgi:hypothetical protein
MPSAIVDGVTHDVVFRAPVDSFVKDEFTYGTRCGAHFRLEGGRRSDLPTGTPCKGETTCLTCIGLGPLRGVAPDNRPYMPPWYDEPPWRGP